MHYAAPLVLWVMSFAAAFTLGRSWVEAKHAGGLAWITAWALGVLTAIGFTASYAYVAVIVLELLQSDPITPEMTAPLWDIWVATFVVPATALGGVAAFNAWARNYRQQISDARESALYAAMNAYYARVKSTQTATRNVIGDVRARTRRRLARWGVGPSEWANADPVALQWNPELPKIELPKIDLPKIDIGATDSGGGGDSDGGAGIAILVVAIVVAIIAVCLGGITTWIIISRVAGDAEPMPALASKPA